MAESKIAENLYYEARSLFNDPNIDSARLDEAERKLRTSAQAGFPSAQLDLADMLHRGHRIKQDQAEAGHWYERASSYFPGEGLIVAKAYFLGSGGFPKDRALANRIYRAVAQCGVPSVESLARCELGRNYYNGDGANEDPLEAERQLRMSLNLDPTNGKAAHVLGLMYCLTTSAIIKWEASDTKTEAHLLLRHAVAHGRDQALIDLARSWDSGFLCADPEDESQRTQGREYAAQYYIHAIDSTIDGVRAEGMRQALRQYSYMITGNTDNMPSAWVTYLFKSFIRPGGEHPPRQLAEAHIS